MHFSQVLLATVAAVAPVTSAHGSGIPQIIGLPVHGQARDLLHKIEARIAEAAGHNHAASLEARADKPECGAGIGSCPQGKCCSRSGFCGTSGDHCYSPGCKYEFGPGCPENNPPAGTNTSSIDRAKLGNLTYGGKGIWQCVKPGTVALTYDDGPQRKFTSHILDLFKSYNAKGTFFITGNNIAKGQIDVEEEYINVIKRMDAEKHQIASHTWTHLDLSNVSSVDRKNQLWMNEMALRNIVGKIPTYMRPPYSSCTEQSGCEKDMADLGYHVTFFKLDTDDYNRNTPDRIQFSKDVFTNTLTNNSNPNTHQHLSITHDILDQTANNLTEYMLSELTKLGYKAVTVGECLGDPEANWYRAADGYGNSTELNIKNNVTYQGPGSGNSNNTQGGDGKSPSTGNTQNTPGAANLGFSSLGPLAIAGVALFVSAFATII